MARFPAVSATFREVWQFGDTPKSTKLNTYTRLLP